MPNNTYVVNRVPNSPGFVLDNEKLCCRDSGYAAINLALLFKAKKIAIVGFDGTYREWFHPHALEKVIKCDPPKGVKRTMHTAWKTAAQQCRDLGAEVVNGSPESACQAWRRTTPEEALKWIAER